MTDSTAHILVVDDDVLLGRVMKRMLKPYEVTVTESGQEALDEVKETSFDLVLCDVMMPELSGPEFFQRLGEIRPEMQPRVIFMTGGALDRVQPLLEDIPNRCLEKPFSRDALKKLVVEFLDS